MAVNINTAGVWDGLKEQSRNLLKWCSCTFDGVCNLKTWFCSLLFQRGDAEGVRDKNLLKSLYSCLSVQEQSALFHVGQVKRSGSPWWKEPTQTFGGEDKAEGKALFIYTDERQAVSGSRAESVLAQTAGSRYDLSSSCWITRLSRWKCTSLGCEFTGKRQNDNVQCEVTWAVIFRCLQPLRRIWNVRNSSELFCFSSQGVIISSALGKRSQSVTSPSWLEKILWMLSEAQL